MFGGLRERCNSDVSGGSVLADCTYSIVVFLDVLTSCSSCWLFADVSCCVGSG